jgi:hypothetical protein
MRSRSLVAFARRARAEDKLRFKAFYFRRAGACAEVVRLRHRLAQPGTGLGNCSLFRSAVEPEQEVAGGDAVSLFYGLLDNAPGCRRGDICPVRFDIAEMNRFVIGRTSGERDQAGAGNECAEFSNMFHDVVPI